MWHIFYKTSVKAFLITQNSQDQLAAKLFSKRWPKDYRYIASKSKINLNRIAHFKKEEGLYFVNESTMKDIAKLFNVEYEEVWNIVNDFYSGIKSFSSSHTRRKTQ